MRSTLRHDHLIRIGVHHQVGVVRHDDDLAPLLGVAEAMHQLLIDGLRVQVLFWLIGGSNFGRRQDIIDNLRAEHGKLERLIRLFDGEPIVAYVPTSSKTALLVDALYYLTHFPDINHHVLENRIAERLLEKHAFPQGLGNEIETQHATLINEGHELLQALESLLRDENMSNEGVDLQLRLYGERLRHNMVFEELTLFPRAIAILDSADWHAIAAAGPDAGADPLFQTPVHERFAQLHSVIVGEAGGDWEDVA